MRVLRCLKYFVGRLFGELLYVVFATIYLIRLNELNKELLSAYFGHSLDLSGSYDFVNTFSVTFSTELLAYNDGIAMNFLKVAAVLSVIGVGIIVFRVWRVWCSNFSSDKIVFAFISILMIIIFLCLIFNFINVPILKAFLVMVGIGGGIGYAAVKA